MYKQLNREELKEIRNLWIEPPIEAIPEEVREKYLLRKKAVDLYIDGENTDKIKRITGIRTHIYNYVEKCCLRQNGSYVGYKALIPYARILPNSENGKFKKLLGKYPEARDYLLGCYYGDKKYTLEKNMNYTSIHQKFLKKLIDLGVDTYEYPFTTASLAYGSLVNYLHEYDKKNIELAATRGDKDDLKKLNSTGYGTRFKQDPIAPYSMVQVDGHKLDIAYYVEIENIDGTIDKTMALRPWLIVVIDVATRVVLGYSISQEENYNQYDVMEAIQDAIVPRTRMQLDRIKAVYPESGGYVSFELPQLRYALFDTIMLDNAKCHLAINTVNRLTERLGITLNYGSVATPETRGIVERFFGSLETRGFHKLPFTTGSNFKSPKRTKPEENCIKYDITFDDIKQLVELLIAEYNTTPHSALQNLAPLECMKRRVEESGMIPTIATEELKNKVDKLHYIIDTRVVVGGKSGKRAHINYNNSIYRNDLLSATNEYIGKRIILEINPRDISMIDAFDLNGNYLGKLYAQGEYGIKSHSIKTRKAASKLARQRGNDKDPNSTPLEQYQQELQHRSTKSRRAATNADILRREMKEDTTLEYKTEDKSEVNIDKSIDNLIIEETISNEDISKLISMTPDEKIRYLYKG